MAKLPQGILLISLLCCIATVRLQKIKLKGGKEHLVDPDPTISQEQDSFSSLSDEQYAGTEESIVQYTPTDTKFPEHFDLTMPPSITREPAKETAYKPHERVVLDCQASGNPEPEYEWYKNGDPLDITGTDIEKTPGKGTITIRSPTSEHDGIYQCRATNEFGTAVSIKALLKYARQEPFATVVETPVHTEPVGSFLKLECKPPVSYPKANIFWVKSAGAGASNDEDSSFNKITTDRRVSLDYQGSLYFANLLASDTIEGWNYVCMSENQFLRTSSQGDDQRIQVLAGNLYFANIEANDGLDGKKYVCVANNNVLRVMGQGSDQKVVPLRPTATPGYQATTYQWSSPSPTTAIKGKNVRMKCIFSGYPTPTVTWRRKSGGSGTRLSPNMKVLSHGQELKITNVSYADDGDYECVANNTETENPVRHIIKLNVESTPEWHIKPKDVIASEEENAEFHCEATGKPKPDVTWSVNGKALTEVDNPRRTVRNGVLRYTNLTSTDTQVLQCNASNAHGYSYQNAYLNVRADPPNIYEAPDSSKKAAEGQTVIIRCKVYGAPKPKVIWRRGNPPEEVTGSRYKILEDGDLEITDAEQSDEGEYECFARNKFGDDSKSGGLTVRRATKITEFPENKVVRAGTDVQFSCAAVTDPHELHHLVIEWRRDGDPIDYSREVRFKKESQFNTLTISNAQVGDTGQYTCYATNDIDSDEATATLTVRDRPDAPFNVKLLSCLTRTAEISWIPGPENNAEVEEYIVYYNTSFDAEGQYHEAKRVPKGIEETSIGLSPWANYTFHVKARNEVGTSDASAISRVCTTKEAKPDHHPKNVCTESREPDQLVIVWDRVEQIDQNGEGFHYTVHFKRTDLPGNIGEEEAIVSDWKIHEYIVEKQEPFKEYEIRVMSHNNEGEAPKRTLQKKLGYSGEDVPLVTPEDFAIMEDSINATSAIFTWTPVDDDPALIRGHFKGYLIKFWKSGEGMENAREHLVPVGKYEPCPDLDSKPRSRHQRAADVDRGHVLDLWPYSRITAGVLVVNGGKSGAMSDTIDFNTPEGVPGIVGSIEITETGSHHMKVEWTKPKEPNGILVGYTIGYQKSEKPQEIKKVSIDDPDLLYGKIKNLSETTDYTIFVWAKTIKGEGVPDRTEGRTLVAGVPDRPAIANLEPGDGHILVSWDPTEDEGDDANPGSEFYVEYRPAGSSGPWERSVVEPDHNNMNITGLDNGQRYEVRIVASNKHGETFSDPETVQVGAAATPPVEGTDEAPIAAGKKEEGVAMAGWFIGMLLAIIFLVIIIIIVCLIKRNRGGKYPVHEKEKLRGNNPEKEDEEERFGEYTRGPYSYRELNSDDPDPKKSAGSLNSLDKPLESETDSMAEYDQMDPSKFNEDGSFIGQYGGTTESPKKTDKVEPDATSPSALSTLV